MRVPRPALSHSRTPRTAQKFNSNVSSSFERRGKLVESRYGQGRVVSEVHYEKVTVGDLEANHVSVLLMLENGLRNFDESSYDGVMGLGVQGNARPEDEDPSLMTSFQTDVVSLCYGQEDQEPGRVDLGAPIPTGSEYTTFNIVGTRHWALQLEGVSAGQTALNGHCAPPEHCSAIVDSGTSLIALPPAMLSELENLVGEVNDDCSNVNSLPSIIFDVAGKKLELPPQLYVARMANDAMATQLPAWWSELPHSPFKLRANNSWSRLLQAPPATGESCVPLFMEIDMATEGHGPLAILGMPFLRAYSASFDRRDRTVGLSKLELGSKVCTGCAHHGMGASSVHKKHAETSALLPTGLRNKVMLPPQGKGHQDGLQLPKLSVDRLMVPHWAVTAANTTTRRRLVL